MVLIWPSCSGIGARRVDASYASVVKRSSSIDWRRSAAPSGRDRRRFLALTTIVIGSLAAADAIALSVGHDDPPTTPAPDKSPAPSQTPAPELAPAPAQKPAPEVSPDAAAHLTVAQVLDRYVEAIGGRDAWLAESSRTITMRIEVRSAQGPGGSGGEAAGTMVVQRQAPDRLASRTTIPGVGEFRQVSVGARAWSIGADGQARELTGAELSERRREANFDRDLRLGELYDRVEVVGRRDFDDESCWLLQFSDDDGAVAQGWFSVERGLMRGFARRLAGPTGPLNVVQTFSDYRDFGGRRMPGRISQIVGPTTQVLTIESVEDTCLDEAIFELPESLRARPTNDAQP